MHIARESSGKYSYLSATGRTIQVAVTFSKTEDQRGNLALNNSVYWLSLVQATVSCIEFQLSNSVTKIELMLYALVLLMHI